MLTLVFVWVDFLSLFLLLFAFIYANLVTPPPIPEGAKPTSCDRPIKKRRQNIWACRMAHPHSTVTGLSIYSDGPPLLTPCPNAAEAELRRLFDQIPGGFPKRTSGDLVSEILGFASLPGCTTDILDRWLQRLYSDGASLCVLLSPEIKGRIRQLVGKLLDDRIAGATVPPEDSADRATSSKNRYDPLSDMLVMLKDAAADQCGMAGEVPEWKEEALRARQALSLNTAHATEFPYRKKRRTQLPRGTSSSAVPYKPHAGQNGKFISQETTNHPTRRSRRALSLLKFGESRLSRKRIPIGEFFQADVPEWTGPPTKRDGTGTCYGSDDSRWLGTRIWPIDGDDRETSEMVGKGRPELCTCSFSGSIECIKFHVDTSKLQLRSDLGLVFYNWGFDRMGEVVSRSWTKEEQMWFDYIMITNSLSQGKRFWEPALKHFHYKKSRDVASYYFNVFVLRRIRNQTRLALGTVDSDDDESNTSACYVESNGNAIQASYTRYLKGV